MTNEGIVMRMAVDSVSVIGRNTQGVKLMNVDQSEEIKVSGLARVRKEDLPEETEDEAADDSANEETETEDA